MKKAMNSSIVSGVLGSVLLVVCLFGPMFGVGQDKGVYERIMTKGETVDYNG